MIFNQNVTAVKSIHLTIMTKKTEAKYGCLSIERIIKSVA